MCFDNMLQQLARCALAALSAPVIGNKHVAVGTPDALDEDRVLGHGNVAGRSPGDSSKTGEGLMPVITGVLGGKGVRSQADLGAHGTNPASISVDDTRADSNAFWETKILCCLFGEGATFLAGGEVGSVL